MKKLVKLFSILFFIATISFVFLTTMPMVASGMTEQEMVEHDTELVTVPTTAIGSFPVAVKSVYANIITWESNNENVVFMDGWFVVKRQVDEDINVEITVTVVRPDNPEITATRVFDLFVPKGVTIRTEYSITYHDVESTEGFKTSYLVGDETYVLPIPTKEGFIFEGWFTTPDYSTKIEKILVGSKQNFNLYAKWKSAYAPYSVQHQLENLDGTYTVEISEPKVGLIDSEVSIEPKLFEGFTYNEAISNPSGAVLEDGSLVLVLKYTRNTYTLTIDDGEDSTYVLLKFGQSLNLPVLERDGYVFNGWDTELTTMPSHDLTVTALWTALEVDYSVEFYFEDLEGYYVLDESQTLYQKAITDTFVTVPTTTFLGFTLNESHPEQILSEVVAGNGSTVLKAYFNRNSYSLTIVYDNDEPNGTMQLKFEEPIEVTTPTKQGYKFVSWSYLVDTMPANNLTIIAIWEPDQVAYEVQYYLESLSGGFGEDTDAKIETTGLTGDEVMAEVMNFPGFTFDEENPNNIEIGTILPDGSLVLKLYYTRNSYTLTVNFDNGEENYVGTLKFGAEINVEEPVKDGFSFAGWNPELPETMPAHDLTVTAQWSALPVYQVSFDSQGGLSVSTQNIIEGQTATEPLTL